MQPLPSKRRVEGTLLGVAPPRSPAALPSRRNPVVVHSGISTVDSAPQASARIAREAGLPVPTVPISALAPKVSEDGLADKVMLGRDAAPDREGSQGSAPRPAT